MSAFSIAEVFYSDRVLYECSCGLKKPITLSYFCRHCVQLRCKDCVSHEVDSQYCQHCLEYIPTIDAKRKKNKCASCYVCPCCLHTLSTRSYMVQVQNESDPTQMTARKASCLICGFCKWTSKDVGIDDQFVASGGWPEIQIPNSKRIDALFDYYRIVAQREKMEKEKKRINPRTGHAIHLLDKYGISASLSPKVTESLRAKLYSGRLSSGSPMIDLNLSQSNPERAVSSCKIEPIDMEKYYKSEIELSNESTIEQRLSQIELQPSSVKNFYPISKMLSVKRSLRCKQCDHNLSKPEYNPSSIKFKIQLSAFYYIPEVRIKSLPKLQVNQRNTVELTIKNPSPYMMHVTFLKVEDSNDDIEVTLPTGAIQLNQKDDTLELDLDQTEQSKYQDDPKLISFRRGNKVGVLVDISSKEVGECKISFILQHDFVNNIVQLPSNTEKEAQVSFIKHKLFVNLGPIS